MFLIVVFRDSFQGSEDQLDQGQKISWREIGRVHAGLQRLSGAAKLFNYLRIVVGLIVIEISNLQ